MNETHDSTGTPKRIQHPNLLADVQMDGDRCQSKYRGRKGNKGHEVINPASHIKSLAEIKSVPFFLSVFAPVSYFKT